jgi:hypothetical protein
MRIALGFVLLVLASCAARPVPPPLPLSPLAAPPAIAETPPVDDPALLGLFRVRDAASLLLRLGANAKQVALDLHAGPFAVFAWEPLAGRGDMPALLSLLPVAEDGEFARSLQSRFNGVRLQKAGGDTLGSLDPELLVRGLGVVDTLRALADAPMQEDAQLYINTKAVAERYEPLVLRDLGKAQSKAMLERGFQQLHEIESTTIGVQVRDDAYLFTIVNRAAAASTATAGPSPELIRYLPPGQLRMESTAQHWRQSTAWPAMLFSGANQMLARDLNAEWARSADKLQYAFSTSITKGGVHIAGLTAVSDADTATRIDEKQLELWRSLATLSASSNACSIRLRRDVRRVEGWPVARFEASCMTGGAGSDLERTFPIPIAVESVKVGNYLVNDVNGTAGELDRIVRELLTGRPSGVPLSAGQTYPEGAFMRLDVDVGAVIEALAPQSPSSRLPPLVMTGFERAGVTQYRGRIAVPTAAAIARVVQAFMADAKPSR